MSGAASIKKGVLLLLAAILFTWLLIWFYGWINLSLWQRELQHKLAQFATNKPSASLITPNENSLLLSDIKLPDLPLSPTSNSAAESFSSPRTVQATVAQNLEPAIQPQPVLPVPVSQTELKQKYQPTSAQPTTQSAEQIYQQLQSDQALDLQIALPANSAQRNHLLNYLYRCAGMQFALLQQQNFQQQLSYLSPKRYVPVSQWLRVANGALSPQEQQWLSSQSGTAIRIFPQSIDQRLSHYIASNLQGKKLKSLRASYNLTASGLTLNNIELNKQSINGEWTLHRSQCAI